MKNKGTLTRMFFALSLILALGVAPGLSAYAQQAAQPAPRAGVAAEQATKASEEKPQQPSAEDEPLPLSDAEMEKVEGGANWAPIVRFGGKAVGWLSGLLGGGKAPAPQTQRNTTIVYCGRR